MADAWQTFPIEFRGGLVTNLSPLQQGLNAPGSATILQNYEPSVEGGYRRLAGFIKADDNQLSGSGVIRGLLRYKTNIYAARGTTLYKSAGSGWTSVSTSLGGTGKVRFAKYNFDGNEKFIVVDGLNKPFTYDNSTFTSLTKAPSAVEGADFVTVFKNAIFIANGTKLVYTEGYADLDSQQKDSGVSSLFNLAEGAGDIDVGGVITDLIVFREQLIIFTQDSIKRLVGNSFSDFVLQPISDDLGAIETDTAQEVGGDIMFLGPDGLRLLGATEKIGDFGLSVVSKSIQSEITNVVSNSNSFSSLVIREKSQYRIFGFDENISSESALGILGTQLLESSQMAWAETRGIKAYVTYSEYDGGEEFIYFANNDGYVYRLERGRQFDGTNIVSSFRTPYIAFQDPRVRKTFYKLFLYTDPTGSVQADVSLKLDFDRQNTGLIQPNSITFSNVTDDLFTYGSITSKFGTATYSDASLETTFETQLIGSGFTAALQVDSNDNIPPFTLDAVTIEYTTNDRR